MKISRKNKFKSKCVELIDIDPVSSPSPSPSPSPSSSPSPSPIPITAEDSEFGPVLEFELDFPENEISDSELFTDEINEIPICPYIVTESRLKSLKSSLNQISQNTIEYISKTTLYQRLVLFKTHAKNLFTNQIDLMLWMMPAWIEFLADKPAYGHFLFINGQSTNVAVYLTLDFPQLESNSNAHTHTHALLIKAIIQVFEPYGCNVSNCHINYLDDQTRYEKYHQLYLSRPVTNQRYQLFLLALANQNNWDHYLAKVEEWEIRQLVIRYLRTNLLMMLSELFVISNKFSDLTNSSNVSESNSSNVSESNSSNIDFEHFLGPWVFIIDPFYRLEHPQSMIRDLAFESVSNYQIKNQYLLIDRLINLSYKVNQRQASDDELPTQGIWKKVFRANYGETLLSSSNKE